MSDQFQNIENHPELWEKDVIAFVGWELGCDQYKWDDFLFHETMEEADIWTSNLLKNSVKKYDSANYYHKNSLQNFNQNEPSFDELEGIVNF